MDVWVLGFYVAHVAAKIVNASCTLTLVLAFLTLLSRLLTSLLEMGQLFCFCQPHKRRALRVRIFSSKNEGMLEAGTQN